MILQKTNTFVGLKIYLLMQGPWVQSLVQEDPTCLGAAKPAHRNCRRSRVREPALHNRSSQGADPVHRVRTEPERSDGARLSQMSAVRD